jgi:hypothetical protein
MFVLIFTHWHRFIEEKAERLDDSLLHETETERKRERKIE